MKFQKTGDRKVDKKDHVWIDIVTSWKCILCGAITQNPPKYPTDDEWLPEGGYQQLTDKERQMSRILNATR